MKTKSQEIHKLQGKTILLLIPGKALRQRMTDTFTQAGCHVLASTKLKTILSHMGKHAFDLMIFDLDCGVYEGYNCIKACVKLNIPVIQLTDSEAILNDADSLFPGATICISSKGTDSEILNQIASML